MRSRASAAEEPAVRRAQVRQPGLFPAVRRGLREVHTSATLRERGQNVGSSILPEGEGDPIAHAHALHHLRRSRAEGHGHSRPADPFDRPVGNGDLVARDPGYVTGGRIGFFGLRRRQTGVRVLTVLKRVMLVLAASDEKERQRQCAAKLHGFHLSSPSSRRCRDRVPAGAPRCSLSRAATAGLLDQAVSMGARWLGARGRTASAEGGSWGRIRAGQVDRRKHCRDPLTDGLRRSGASCRSIRQGYHPTRTDGRTFGRTGGYAAIHVLVTALHLPARRHGAVRVGHGERRPRRNCQGQCQQDQGEQTPHRVPVSPSGLNRQLHSAVLGYPIGAPDIGYML